MTYHFNDIDQEIANHINSHFKDLGYGFMDQCYALLGHVDIHGQTVKTFTHAIRVMVDDGFFLCYYSQIIEFLTSLANERNGYLPYNRSNRPIDQWSCDQLWCFYRTMIVRSGIKYLDMLRKQYVVNYNGMLY